MINQNNNTITSSALYLVEMESLSFALIPSFEILGDKMIVDGNEIRSGVDRIQFDNNLGSQTKTITIHRGDFTRNYTLTILFSEDPDSTRSITDFRFAVQNNSLIAATAVGSIINTGATGTINVQVFYSVAKPTILRAQFITPGTASVNGVVQTSGANLHDFSSSLEYRVVSRNGMFTRVYTVNVEFISLSEDSPRITSFGFPLSLNHELVQDAVGEIGDGAGMIMVNVLYRGTSEPLVLIPEFRAEGIVRVSGSVQISGASPQNFIWQIRYTVTNPLQPLLTRNYWVQVHFTRDTMSDAAITLFGFYPQDNDGLEDEFIARIDQGTGRITIFAPIGSGISERFMVPRFTAAGVVSVGGIVQASGASMQTFDSPVVYSVVSANGNNRREYTVDVREVKSTIFVNQNAWGENDGTSWQDAFRSLQSACEAAALFPEDVPKEIWIASGTYTPGTSENDYFMLTPNTSYIGGFAGNETAKSQRNVEANKVTVSGNLGAGRMSRNLFSYSDFMFRSINGDLAFEDLTFTDAMGALGTVSIEGNFVISNSHFSEIRNPLDVRGGRLDLNSIVLLKDSTFHSTGMIQILSPNKNIAVQNIQITASRATSSLPALSISSLLDINISGVTIEGLGNNSIGIEIINSTFWGTNYSSHAITVSDVNISNFSIAFQMPSSTVRNLTVTNLTMEDIANTGFNFIRPGGSQEWALGVVRLSGIEGRNIGGAAISLEAGNVNGFMLEDSIFHSTGQISIGNASSSMPIIVRDVEIRNSRATPSLRLQTSADITIDRVTIDGVPFGG
jgi:hypothetical protein